MKTSDSTAAIDEALAAFQCACPKIRATEKGRSESGEEYDYAALGPALELMHPVLAKCGLSLTQDTYTEGNRVCVVSRLGHTSGEWLQSGELAMDTDGSAWAIGSALTYLRRYQGFAICGVAPVADDDGAGAQKSRRKPAAGTRHPTDLSRLYRVVSEKAAELSLPDEDLAALVRRIGRSDGGAIEGLTANGAGRVLGLLATIAKIRSLRDELAIDEAGYVRALKLHARVERDVELSHGMSEKVLRLLNKRKREMTAAAKAAAQAEEGAA